MTVTTEPTVYTRGRVSEGDRQYALEKVEHLVRLAPRPVLNVQVRLYLEPDPARSRPAFAEASLEVNGRPVRAQVAAATMREATDFLEARLRRRIDHLAGRTRALRQRHRDSGPGEWRHGDEPSERPEYFPLPVEQREVVRRKTFVLRPETPEEASLDLELLDHDFLLFENADTGEDNLLHRAGDGRYELVSPGPGDGEAVEGAAVPITASARVPEPLDLAAAVQALDLAGEPFLFFLDPETGRGRVVYRRYDGHYGLIAPAT